MHFDLHMHSVNSHDGFYSEKELIARAKEKKTGPDCLMRS